MKRRTFIQRSGLAAAGTALLPSSVFSGGKPSKKPFTVIIGAGMAGLGAAQKLKEAEHDYLVLEARKRTGGRVFTYDGKEFEGLVMELGAEWIGEHHTALRKFNEDHKVTEQNHQFDTRLILEDKYFNKDEWGFDESENKFKAALKYFRDTEEKKLKPVDKIDYWHYLKQLGVSDQFIEMRELMDSTDFGESIRHVSAFAALSEYAFSSDKNEMDYKATGGNHQMIKALENIVGLDKIKTDHAVESVKQKGKKIKITCTNGFTIECDKVICTLPTYSVLKIKWEPGFPSAKKDALDSLQYCRIVKTSILYNERFWKDEAFDMMTDTLGHYFFHSTKSQPGTKGVLTSYATGDRAYVLSKMDRNRKIEELTRSLYPAFGNVKKYAEQIISYYWGNDQQTQGAYAIYDTSQWFSHRLELAEPFKNIHFAGEHLAEWQGFMEGAYVTGGEAAMKIIQG